jgi:hypothetical protein
MSDTQDATPPLSAALETLQTHYGSAPSMPLDPSATPIRCAHYLQMKGYPMPFRPIPAS